MEWWEVQGCSWKGNIVKRDGKPVRCGHRHKTERDCEKCIKKMRAERPGHCQNYRSFHIIALIFRKER